MNLLMLECEMELDTAQLIMEASIDEQAQTERLIENEVMRRMQEAKLEEQMKLKNETVGDKARKLIGAIKEFIVTAIKALGRLFKDMKEAVGKKLDTIIPKKRLEQLKKQLAKTPDAKVETYDYPKIGKLYNDYANKMNSLFAKAVEIVDGSGEYKVTFNKAKALLNDAKKVDAKYRKLIEQTKNTKTQVNAAKCLDWLDKNLETMVSEKGPLAQSIKTIEDYHEKLGKIEEKYVKYCTEKGYVPFPSELSSYMVNTSKFIHKNMGWVVTSALSTLFIISAVVQRNNEKKSGLEKDISATDLSTAGAIMSVAQLNETRKKRNRDRNEYI